MFERYTEKARRTIFFGRYEASQFGSGYIETEHLLLGLLREDGRLRRLLPDSAADDIRREIRKNLLEPNPPIPTSVDLPLSSEAKRSLELGAEEAEKLNQRSIDCGHLVLGLLRIENCGASGLLQKHGINYAKYRRLVASARPEVMPTNQFQAVVPEEPHQSALVGRAAPAIRDQIAKLEQIIEHAVAHLGSMSAESGDQRLKRRPWSRKQAVGHLIDWAAIHQGWFARALTEPKVVAHGYPAEDWVEALHYELSEWRDLLMLWASLNRQLVHTLSHIPEGKLSTPCRVGIEAPVSLRELVERYVGYCEDLAGQILAHG